MDAHEHVFAIANVAHDHRDVHVAGGTFERVNVEQAERRRQRDTNRFTAVRRDGDHLGEHAAAVYPDPITGKLTSAPGNGAPIGGLKVMTENGWFAARPSGTEDIYKIYAESFKDQRHLAAIVQEAQEIVTDALGTPASALQEHEVR